jgi:nucleotide-binding universal stress UspA family protein
LYLLHVVKKSRYRSYRYDWPDEADEHAGSGIPLPGRLILPGSPAQMIVAYADHIDADLILMPTRGHGQLGQLFLGSTTMDVIRSTTRTVWVTRKPVLNLEVPFSCKRIVCGIDVNSEGYAVLQRAVKTAATWNAELIVVHAIPGLGDAVLTRYELGGSDDIEMLSKAACREIRSMGTAASHPFKVEVTIGDPVETVNRAIRKWSADLVIIGRGKSTNRWSVGRNIGEIIARSRCPVITYRPEIVNRAQNGNPCATWARNSAEPDDLSAICHSDAPMIAAWEPREPEPSVISCRNGATAWTEPRA